jgi:hypothetical protein
MIQTRKCILKMESGRCDTSENKMCQKGIASETTMKMMHEEVGIHRTSEEQIWDLDTKKMYQVMSITTPIQFIVLYDTMKLCL